MRPVGLRTVGLHEHAGGGRELAEAPQQLVRAGRGEPRGDDRLHEPPPRVDGRISSIDRALAATPSAAEWSRYHSGVPSGWSIATRPTNARWPASTATRANAECGFDVDGGEVDRGRGAVAEQRGHHVRPHRARERLVRVAGLERERVLEQPPLERQVQPRAQLRPLRGMDVQVDQPRDQHAARWGRDRAAADRRQRAAGLAARRLDRGDQAPVIDGDDGVLDDLQAIRGGRLHQPGGDNERHGEMMARAIPPAWSSLDQASRATPRARHPQPKEPVVSVVLPGPERAFGGVIAELATASTPARPEIDLPPEGAPNVMVVMYDDVGFGAASTFGGPVPTPALDRVAAQGVTYNQFHTTALCSPTRAALLTGRNHHSAHMGGISRSPTASPATTGSSRAARPPSPRSSGSTATARRCLARRTSHRCGRRAPRGRSTAGPQASGSSASTASWAARPRSGNRPSTTRRRRSSRMSDVRTTT